MLEALVVRPRRLVERQIKARLAPAPWLTPPPELTVPAVVQPKFMPCEHGAVRRLWRSLSYNVHTYLARRKEIVADLPWLGVSLRAGSEDMLGRRLFKTGMYEAGVTNFLLHYLSNAPQDVVFDIGANVGHAGCRYGVSPTM